MGRHDEALAELQAALQLSGGSSYVLAEMVNQLTRMGRDREARETLDELVRRSQTTYVPPCDMALAYMGVGDTDAAMDWLRKGYQQRDPKMVFLELEEVWQVLRNRADFVELLARMNLPIVRS